jgi:hypothetical protein
MKEEDLLGLRNDLVKYIRGLRDELGESIDAFVECPLSDVAQNNVKIKMKEIKDFMKDLMHIQCRLDNTD